MKNINILTIIRKGPHAVARIRGSKNYPQIQAVVEFFQTKDGVLLSVEASGLPKDKNVCEKPIFAIHIHSGGSCTGNETDPFADAMVHYNPDDCKHPHHAGDLAPLFGVNGSAFSLFLTDRFSVKEVIGKTVIIHSKPDDFTTQPAGNSGEKIACGVIEKGWLA